MATKSNQTTQQHTPGPWTPDCDGGRWWVSGPRTKRDANVVAISHLAYRSRPTDRDFARGWEEEQANARLIAAAPDMLALLSGFVRDAARLGDTPDSDQDKARALKAFLHMVYTTGGALIARATGAQP